MPEDLKSENKKLSQILSFFAVLIFAGVIVSNFYFLYFQKDFDFIVETSCDPLTEECFVRDCSVPETCPPNELENFKRYSISARDFGFCQNEDCAELCERNGDVCEKIACVPDPEYGEECSSPLE